MTEPFQENQEVPPISQKSEPIPYLTGLVCVVCVVIFLAIAGATGKNSDQGLGKFGYVSPLDIWGGKYWGLLSSVFVHLELWHLVFNLYWMWILGRALEKTIGSVRFGAFFLGAAVVSSGLQFATGEGTGIGASGVVYAIFGYLWIARDRYELFQRTLPRQTVNLFLGWLFACILLTYLNLLNVGNEAHFGGVLFGTGMAAIFEKKFKVPLVVAGEVLLCALVVVPLFWCPWSMLWVSQQGVNAQLKGDYKAALQWYQKSLNLGQDPAWAWGNIASVYAAAGNQTKLHEAVEELRKHDPEAAKAFDPKPESENSKK